MLNLPKPLETYFEAANAQDREAFISCFADDAFVRDEGKGHKGHDAIAKWNANAIQKYNCSYKVLSCEPTADGALVTANVSGTFPGSPIELTYSFIIEDNLIKEMGIE